MQRNISTETKTIDSLKRGLDAAKNDSTRIMIMQHIGFSYELLNLDSSLKYTQAGLALARERGYAWGEAMLMRDLATILREQGKLAESLDLLFKTLKITKTNNITSVAL
jgi:hypothetical protein